MFGFSIPKVLILFIIIYLTWHLFKFFENKNKNKNKIKKNNNNQDALTECKKCGGFYDKSIISECPLCTTAYKNE